MLGEGIFQTIYENNKTNTAENEKKSSGADHVTFVGGRGGMGDLVWVRIFPPNLWRISSLTYNSVRLFFHYYTQ